MLLWDQDDDNFLFTPCGCKGSCGAVHREFLMKWMTGKYTKKVIPNGVVFNIKNFNCEICKFPFPTNVVHRPAKQMIDLLPVSEYKKGNYIVLNHRSQNIRS